MPKATTSSGRRDKALQETAYEACWRKIHCAARGYLSDPFVKFFTKDKTVLNSPMMNRGTWLRTMAVECSIKKFSRLTKQQDSAHPGAIQVVSFGAGVDTLYLRLKHDNNPEFPIASFIEIDLPEIVAEKRHTIDHNENLKSLCGPEYHLCAGDLRDPEAIKAILKEHLDLSIPTVLLAEMVFVYLAESVSTGLLDAVMKDLFIPADANVLLLSYNAVQPNDPFGAEMVDNLQQRNLALESIHAFPDPQSYEKMARSVGFPAAKGWSMRQLFLTVPHDTQVYLNRLEMVDDFDEWNLIHNHYCFLVAWTKGETPDGAPKPFDAMSADLLVFPDPHRQLPPPHDPMKKFREMFPNAKPLGMPPSSSPTA